MYVYGVDIGDGPVVVGITDALAQTAAKILICFFNTDNFRSVPFFLQLSSIRSFQ